MSTSSSRRGQHDDRDLALRSQAAADLEAVEPRQHHVEDDEVELLLGEAVERLAAVAGRDHLVALLAQRVGEQRLHGLLVVDEQDSSRLLSRRAGRPGGAASGHAGKRNRGPARPVGSMQSP